MLLKSKTLSVSIACSPKKVYNFVSTPENLPRWAKGLCKSVRKANGKWAAETHDGDLVSLRFAKKNDFGVLDHYVTGNAEIFVPMRVLPNSGGSEVIFTLFQLPGIADEDFLKDVSLVEKDLRNLKRVMQQRQ